MMDMILGIYKEIMKNEKIKFNSVEYISDNEVKIMYQTKIPDIDISSDEFDGEIDRRMAKKGIDTTELGLEKMTEKEKYNIVIQVEPVAKEILREKLNSKNLKYITEKYTVILKKQNNKWIVTEEYLK